MHRFFPIAFVAALTAAAPLDAQQTMVPPASPTIGASGGLGGGIALPVGRLSDTHAPGYSFNGLVDFSAADQPYSFRLELTYQRYDVRSTAPAGTRNMKLASLGGSLMARRARGAASSFLLGGIAVYHVTDSGAKPGVNLGAGLEVPLTFFIGIADVRVHYVLNEKNSLVTIPITLGARF
jgi:hypothetical protein